MERPVGAQSFSEEAEPALGLGHLTPCGARRGFPGLRARARRESAPSKGGHKAERALSGRGFAKTTPAPLIPPAPVAAPPASPSPTYPSCSTRAGTRGGFR